MGWRDRITGFGRVAATALADGLLDWAGSSLHKAEDPRFEVSEDESNQAAPGGSAEETALSAPVPTVPATRDPKALMWDPFAIIEQMGFKERPSMISYGTLKAIVWKCPVIQSVIQTRVNQVASFARPQHNRYELGFRIKTRNAEDQPTPADLHFIEQMETMLMRTGLTDSPRSRDTFERFLRKLAWDSLVYDQCAFEIVPNRLGQPAEWYAVDGASVRIADTAKTHFDKSAERDVRWVQVYDSMIVAEYNLDEMCFGVRNPRTDMRLHGYGVSELEMLISAVTALLYAWEYNQKFFSQGTASKGILNFKGAIPETQLRQFRRHWYQMLSGVENSWRTPITNAEDLQWIDMQASSRDMEYNAWMDFLIKVACSMYSMDPVEVNFKYGNTGQKGAMNEANNKEKITESKERGLRPLLRFFANSINQNIIWPINENFEFDFVGLDAMTREKTAEINSKVVMTYRMVDELRAEDDLPPLPDGAGQVILNPAWIQFQQQKQQQAQQLAQQQAQQDAMMQQQQMGYGEGGEGQEEGMGSQWQPDQSAPENLFAPEQAGQQQFKSLYPKKEEPRVVIDLEL